MRPRLMDGPFPDQKAKRALASGVVKIMRKNRNITKAIADLKALAGGRGHETITTKPIPKSKRKGWVLVSEHEYMIPGDDYALGLEFFESGEVTAWVAPQNLCPGEEEFADWLGEIRTALGDPNATFGDHWIWDTQYGALVTDVETKGQKRRKRRGP